MRKNALNLHPSSEGTSFPIKKGKWSKSMSYDGIIVWKDKDDPSYSINIVPWKSQDVEEEEEEGRGWGYGYDAINGKGIPNSPEIFETKKEALDWAKGMLRARR